MNTDQDQTASLQDRVQQAFEARTPLCIHGGRSKAFYGRVQQGDDLNVRFHSGVLDYQPSELVITARAGTPLKEIEALLDESAQMLPFEPPHFGPHATLGGAVACGLSGPRRPYAGAARDFVLGVRLLNGRGEVLKFGGQVMKNVAGYDLSRSMAGAMGTLGVLLDISLKVLPRPESEVTLVRELPPQGSLERMNRWAGRSLPLSAGCADHNGLHIRLSGTESGVKHAISQLGGDVLGKGHAYWNELREQQHGFFETGKPLWRVSVPPAAPLLDLPGKWLLDWGGAQRWLYSEEAPERIRRAAAAAGGHACLFRGGDHTAEVFHPLAPAIAGIHTRLKAAMDPHGILNPGRMYAGL